MAKRSYYKMSVAATDQEGRWSGSPEDGRDGSDLLKWIGEQTWSNGKGGTMGTSYGGATQHALAIANALNLAARVPVDAMSNVGRYGVRHNGASLPDALYASEN